MNKYRTHHCGELRETHAGLKVKLAGTLSVRRDHGGIMFLDLRDFYGATQIVVQSPDVSDAALRQIDDLNLESSLAIEGTVRLRPSDQVNPKMETGKIEVVAQAVEIFTSSDPPPFSITKGPEPNEDLRLRYRFLDLRREKMRDMLIARNRLCQVVRDIMAERGFLEIHTPVLSNATPEGARDFLVPSRLHPGKFFALPQSPQQWKQIVMASGVDRYFQIAPCFRDEPARADRSPGEFYQVDIEMAYVEQEDVLSEVEALVIEAGRRFSSRKIITPFPRITFKEALERFGSDKPDLRFGLELKTLTALFADSSVRFLKEAVQRGEAVRGLAVPDGARFSRRELDALKMMAKESEVDNLAWLSWTAEGVKGSLAGAMDAGEADRLRAQFEAQAGTLVILAAGPRKRVDTALNAVRLQLGTQLGLRDPETLLFSWVVDFPLYEEDPETGQIIFSHNPFSMPKGGLDALNTQHPLDILGQQYDLTCNGVEISSGAIRNNIPEALYRAFEIAGYSRADVDAKFGHMIQAFRYGCPPHGGIAPGFERLLMFYKGETSLREVVPFPKNQKCQDLMVNAPSQVDPAQLKELHLEMRADDKTAP